MGFIQKDALRTMLISYGGLCLGYLNKIFFFILILTTEQIGLVNLVFSVGLLFSQFANLGTINAVIKFLPYFKDKEQHKKSFFKLNLGIVFIGIVLVTLIAVLLKPQVIHYFSAKSTLFVSNYFWIIPIGISNVLFVLFEGYLRAHHKNIISVFLNDFVLRLMVSVLLVLLWYKLISFDQFLTLHVVCYSSLPIILFWKIRKDKALTKQSNSFLIPKKFKRIIINFSLFSYSNTLGILLVTTMDTLMITYYEGLKATGVYTTVLYLISAMQVPYRSLIRVSEPLIPKYWKENNLFEMKRLYRNVSSVSLIIILFMFLLVWSNRDALFSFFPKEFLPGMWVFCFLMIGKIIDLYFGLNGLILVTSKKYKFDIIFTVVLLVVVFSLNLFLIPMFGIIGAAIATSVALLTYNLGRMFFVLFVYKIHPFTVNQLKTIAIFISVLLLTEFLPTIEHRLLSIIFNCIIVCTTFLTSIYFLHLEPEINKYISQGAVFLKNKLRK